MLDALQAEQILRLCGWNELVAVEFFFEHNDVLRKEAGLPPAASAQQSQIGRADAKAKTIACVVCASTTPVGNSLRLWCGHDFCKASERMRFQLCSR